MLSYPNIILPKPLHIRVLTILASSFTPTKNAVFISISGEGRVKDG